MIVKNEGPLENAEEYLSKEWVAFDSSKHQITYVYLYNEDKDTDKNYDNSSYELVKMFKDGEDYYIVEEKYLLLDGKYYIHSYCCDITTSRTTLNFEPRYTSENNSVTGASNKTPIEQPDYVKGKDGYYVSGSFDGTYSPDHVVDDAKEEKTLGYQPYPGNNLEAEFKENVWTYKINGQTFEPSKIEYSENEFNYVCQESLDNVFKEAKDTDGNFVNKLGYNYFEKAYYTAEGNFGGWSEKDDKLKQTFYFYGEGKPAGEEKVHYVVQPAVYDQDGKQTQPAYYYTIVKYENITVPQGVDAEISVDLYPNRFINPYTDSSYSSVVDRLTFNKPFVYKVQGQSTNRSIKHSPEYYLFEGGYYVETGDLSSVANGGMPPVYVRVSESGLSVTPFDSSVTIYDSTIKENRAVRVGDITESNYNTYKDKCINGTSGETNASNQIKFSDEYKLVNGIMYKYNNSYTIGSDYLLHKQVIGIPTENRKNVTLFENMYLTNSTYSLYTYYKYNFGATNNPKWTIDGKEYYLVPQKEKSTALNGIPTVLIESCKVTLGGLGEGSIEVS